MPYSRIYKTISYFFLLLCGFCYKANAQEPGIKVYTLHDGIVQPHINCIIQSKFNYLLIGSNNGLYRFNGSQFEQLDIDTALQSQQVTAITEFKKGDTWVGFQTGAMGTIQNGKVIPLIFEEGTFKKAVTKIIEDSLGNRWCATAGEGVYVYNGKHWINFDAADGMSDAYVYDMKLQNQQVLCATDDGLNILSLVKGTKKVEVPNLYGLSDKIVRSLDASKRGTIALGLQERGYYRFSKRDTLSASVGSWDAGQINSIRFDADDNCYTATESGGVICIDRSGIKYSTAENLKRTENLLIDKNDNIWFSSGNRLIKSTAKILQTEVQLSQSEADKIHVLLKVKAGGLYYNIANTLFEKKQDQLIRYLLPVNTNTEFTTLYEDANENIWIGTLGQGIWLLNNATKKITQVESSLITSNGSILSINGKGSTVFITSLEGVYKVSLLKDGTYHFESFTEKDKIGTNYVYSTYTDDKNNVWFATDGRGLAMYNGKNFYTYGEKEGLNSKVIYGVAEDGKNNIWLNTLNDGLYQLKGNAFKNVSVKDGLSENNIASILPDKDGNILAISSKGIDLISQEKIFIKSYDEEFGIININTDPHASSISADGWLYFATSSGIQKLKPEHIVHPLPAYIEQAQLFLKNFDIDSVNSFGYTENNIGFHFNAVDLDHPEKIVFQYQLDGFSTTATTTKDHYINFPRLPPGNYTFRIKASTTGNFSFAPEATYQFSIAKPIWLTWWFITLAIILLVAGIWLIINTRDKQKEKWQELKQQHLQSQLDTLKSQVNPHFFFNSLNTLVALIEEEPKMAVKYTEQLSDFYRKMVQHRFVDLISLEEELDILHNYFNIQHQRFGNALILKIDVNAPLTTHKK